MNTSFENAIIVTRPTRLEQLKSRFNTQEQAKFYIKQKKIAFKQKKIASSKKKLSKRELISLEEDAIIESDEEYQDYEREDAVYHRVLREVQKKVSLLIKTKTLKQDYLPNYIFSKKEIIIVLGQDGLVANTAKYVGGNPIIGVNPDPQRYDGVILPFNRNNFLIPVTEILENNYSKIDVTMAQVKLNDGQTMLAFNDFFIGINSHISANYTIEYQNQKEQQSSSGIIISTGAGSSGWLSSLFNMTNGFIKEFNQGEKIDFKGISINSEYLMFAVREPFVSRTSKANIVVGTIKKGETLRIESNMPQNGIIFSDGIQKDFLDFNSGTIAEIGISDQKAVLVIF